MYKAKRAMKKFAAGWDFSEARVGLRSTSDNGETILLSNSLEKFDRAISGLRYNMMSDRAPTGDPAFLAFAREVGTPASGVPAAHVASSYMGNPAVLRANYDQRIYSLLATINALRSVPGRKAMVLVSEGFTFGRDRDQIGISSPFNELFSESQGVDSVLHMITEVANRASVVIYTLDPSGLVHDGPGADVASAPSAESRQSVWSARLGNHWSLARLSEDTGGLSVYNHNDLAGGLRQIVDDQRSYYLIGFEPPKAAFEKSKGRPKLHEIRLKVSRPGLSVRTRAGFYGVTDDDVIQKAPLMGTPEH
jgi:VWFA-related protein